MKQQVRYEGKRAEDARDEKGQESRFEQEQLLGPGLEYPLASPPRALGAEQDDAHHSDVKAEAGKARLGEHVEIEAMCIALSLGSRFEFRAHRVLFVSRPVGAETDTHDRVIADDLEGDAPDFVPLPCRPFLAIDLVECRCVGGASQSLQSRPDAGWRR